MVEFRVSDVEVGKTRLETISVAEAVHRLTANARQVERRDESGRITVSVERDPPVPCEASSEIDGGVYASDAHPFVATAQLAFDKHLTLELSPDHLWILLSQGFAQHIRMRSDELRHKFVSGTAKETLSVRRDDFVKGRSNPWPEVFDEFGAHLRARIGKRHDLIVADFSTTGPLERAVSQLVLMDAMESYFEYAFHTLCGIPQVRLLGTTEDWKSVRTRAAVFGEFGLDFWVDVLTPILDQFVLASEGTVDVPFWRSMYKRKSESGGPYITGWVTTLFPYLVDHSAESGLARNAFLDWSSAMDQFMGGAKTTQLPAAVSSIPFVWQYLESKLDMQFVGGFVGVRQKTDGSVAPHLGWAIRDLSAG